MGDPKDPKQTRPSFVHPTEEAFARILDYYGIAWEYEPRTFVLERDQDGNIAAGFSPDFYLPDQDLYIELTTVRPSLVTDKNRKVRRLRELYPHVNIKLFKRRDVRDLMIKYGLDRHAENILGAEAQEEP
jgi:hypoxanthine phosphoribosyltransferase